MSDSGSAGFARRLLKPALFVAYCLAVIEVGARIFVATTGLQLDDSHGYPPDLFVEDPDRGYALRAGFRGHFPNAPYTEIPIEINESGFRDGPFDVRDDRRRIVVVGDSITFGAGIAVHERYTDRLEEMVCEDASCDVLNLGVSGYQAENYLAVLEGELASLDPALVVIGFCMNDIQKMSQIDHVAASMRRGLREKIRGLAALSQALRLAARSVRMLTWDPEEYRHRWIRRATAAWSSDPQRERLVATLAEIRRLAHGAGAGLVAVVFPERTQLEEFDTYGESYRAALEIFSDLGVPAVSGRAALSGGTSTRAVGALYLPGDNVHFNPDGHRQIATALAPLVRQALAAGAPDPVPGPAPLP